MLLRPLSLAAVALLLCPQDPPVRRHAQGEKDQGLPRPDAVWAPYHADPEHRLNRIFRALFLAELAPAEISTALPREHADAAAFFAVGWVHAKRAGEARDSRLFGGDGRQLPREGFRAEESARLLEELEALGPADREALLAPAELAVLFQHDLLRTTQRLQESEENPELLPALQRAARFVALDERERSTLSDPLARSLATPAAREHFARRGLGELAALADLAASPYRELLRRSTRLFDAEKTLLWSRLWLAHPEGPRALEALIESIGTPGATPSAPLGLRAILLQGIVAWGQDGSPYATPVVLDVRTQRLTSRDELSHANPTFTRDGIDFGVLLLEREGLRRGDPQRFYRAVDADDQELFRDYGTLKHATYRAQCSLCHRNTGTPEPELGGFPVLRAHAKPELARTGVERLRLAETEMQRFLARFGTAKGD
ncbi:MAG: hypothetical protein IPN34_19575 [Planctomycetes bacterium]|nr:hypothetical protein [Planctomycetota bacterium]